MLSQPAIENATDSDLWTLVRQGSAEAFEVILRRYQSLVCAVAYSICGELSRSEDIAQETFWTAWRGRESLDQPSKLRSWLCGIARNLGKNARRRASRPVESAVNLDAVAERSTDAPGPAEEAVSREEESLLWDTLEQIPDTFREPLILFYREDQSIAQVASALDLSEDAVKQRLSRGRSMLREQVAELVEGGLRRSRPGRAFTLAVMAGITAGSTGAKTALAAGASAGAAAKAAGPLVKGVAGAGLAGGALGGLLGSLIGLGGGWLGTWIPAQMAPTISERDLILRAGRRMLVVTVISLGILLLLIEAFAGGAAYLIAWGLWFVAFQAYVLFESIRLTQGVKRIRQNAGPNAEPNPAAMRTGMKAMASRYRGRVFRSHASLFGLPIIDINASDPVGFGDTNPEKTNGQLPKVARGWIAIGDDARGIILAIGSTARGFIALGGRTLGVVSLGGVAADLVAFGGLAVGVVSIGGLGLGVYAIGGGAIGWQAAGGGAIAWDTAVGGFALARHAAFGGAAFARDFALGGDGSATHFNDDAAKAALLAHPLKLGMDWYTAHMNLMTIAILVVAILPTAAMLPLMYRRGAKSSNDPPNG